MTDKMLLNKIKEAINCISLSTLEYDFSTNMVSVMVANSLVATSCLLDVKEEIEKRLKRLKK